VLPLTVPPVILVLRHRRQKRRLRQNLCPECGYDLRATKDRCPECGTPIPNPKPASKSQI
jgi:predicted amidophosphoribosyltransferase